MLVTSLALVLAAYLLGSLPFGVWVGRARLGRDIRDRGSGHSGATATIRQAGWAAGLLVVALDTGKGALAVWLALRFGANAYVPALAGAAVVAGHCWPVFAGFRGGMGLAPAGGALLAAYPLGFLAALGLLIAAAFVLRHSARSGAVASLLCIPLIGWMSGSPALTALTAGLSLVITLRALSSWNRKQRAVWAVTEDR